MSDRALEEIYSGDTSTEAPVAETPPVADVAASPSGSEPAPEAAPVQTPEVAAPPAEPQDPMAPVKALLDERDRRQAAERKAAEMERELQAARAERAAQQRKAQEADAQMPHPLDDPDGFGAWLLKRQHDAVQGAVGTLRSQHQQQLEHLSKTMLVRHIGAEKFGELEQFINAAPDQAHAIAMRQADPYGWFYDKFEEAQKHRKAQAALQEIDKFGGKSIEEIVAERVAAELAKRTQTPPAQAAEQAPQRQRNDDGTFATSSKTQRHTPPDLAEVNGAIAASPSERGLALEGLYGDR